MSQEHITIDKYRASPGQWVTKAIDGTQVVVVDGSKVVLVLGIDDRIHLEDYSDDSILDAPLAGGEPDSSCFEEWKKHVAQGGEPW